jgi:hypothetical protein
LGGKERKQRDGVRLVRLGLRAHRPDYHRSDQLGALKKMTRLAVFDGWHHAGFIEQVDGRWRAVGIDGETVGYFATQLEAMRAVPMAKEIHRYTPTKGHA